MHYRGFAEARTFAACTGAQGHIAGSNRGLTLTFQGTAAGGYFYVDQTPKPDPARYINLSATVLEEASCAARPGVAVKLGRLTGDQIDAVDWLAEGILGIHQPAVRILKEVFAPCGVCMYVHPTLTSGTYVFKLQGGIWTP